MHTEPRQRYIDHDRFKGRSRDAQPEGSAELGPRGPTPGIIGAKSFHITKEDIIRNGPSPNCNACRYTIFRYLRLCDSFIW